MRAVLLFLVAVNGFGQSGPLSPTAKYDLNAGLKHRVSRNARSFLGVTENGLTLVTVGEQTSIVSADRMGNILHTTAGVTSIRAQIYRALPLPDGNVWIVAEGPYALFPAGCCFGWPEERVGISQASISTRPYNQLDLYSADGRHLSAVRLPSIQAPMPDFPIAAARDMVVVLGGLGYGNAQTEVVRFESVADGTPREIRNVQLDVPFRRIVSVMAAGGRLFLIDRTGGAMLEIDPHSGSGRLFRPARPFGVRAAAADSGFLYLLLSDRVLKTDLTGGALATYELRFDRGFRPVSLGVTGDDLYLMDNAGRVEQFRIQ